MLRFPLSFPNRADGTILPGILAGMLTAAVAIQFVSVDGEPDLPPVPAVRAIRVEFGAPAIPVVTVAPVIVDRPLFAPRQSPVAGSAGQALPLGGASVAGTVAIRGRVFAVVRRANGTVSNMAIGSAIDGWQLVALGTTSAVFVKNKVRRQIAYGAAPIAAVDEEPSAE